jgi:hypothetical protein
MVDTATNTWADFLAMPDAQQRDTVLSTARGIVAEVGDEYTYPLQTCAYIARGRPVCLVGRIFAQLGLDLETMHRWDVQQGDSTIAVLIANGVDGGLSSIGPRTAATLAAMQTAQDGGGSAEMPREPWSACVEAGAEAAI